MKVSASSFAARLFLPLIGSDPGEKINDLFRVC